MKVSFAFWNRLSKREQLILSVTVLVVGIFISDRIVVQPLVHTYGSLDQELNDLKIGIKKNVRLLSQKERLTKEIKEYARYSVQAKSPEEEAVALLQYIEKLAEKANVNLLYVKPAGSKTEERVKRYYVNLEFEAQMAQLMIFFYQVENSDQLLKIEKYSIQPTAAGSSVVKCALSISRTVAQ